MRGILRRRPSAPARSACLLLLLGFAAAANIGQHDRVVAVGDIHGAYDQFVAILQQAGIIDKNLEWTGGKTLLVQTGDVLDRGPQSRRALDLIMDLVEKAPKFGGEVRPLLGNHESMVMMGDLRYVSPEEYQSYATPESEEVRQKELENYQKYRKQRGSRSPKPPMGETEKRAWLELHPPGFFELRQAFSPKGKYGKWLRGRDAVTQVGEIAFLHGGLSPQLQLKNLKEINDRVRRELASWDDTWNKLVARGIIWQYMNLEEAQAEAKAEWKAFQSGAGQSDPDLVSTLQSFLNLGALTIISPEGPLWYRGYAQQSEPEFAGNVEQVLKRYKVRHIVVGHTIPSTKRITPRFDGRVYMIDTGMLATYFQGRPSALEFNGGHFKAIYVGEAVQTLAAENAKAQP